MPTSNQPAIATGLASVDISMTQEELLKRKTILEIQNLHHTNEELQKIPRKTLYNLLLKFLTALSAIFILVTGVTGPINKYFHERQREYDIALSKDIRAILDAKSDTDINISNIVGVSVAQPRFAASILLGNFNNGFLKEKQTMTRTYKYMYELAKTDWRYQTLFDKITDIFQKSDQDILQEELLKHSIEMYKQYAADTASTDKTEGVTTYLLLITDLGLNTKEEFKKSFNILRTVCKDRDDGICKMIN